MVKVLVMVPGDGGGGGGRMRVPVPVARGGACVTPRGCRSHGASLRTRS